jgi:hypothetical protein
VADVKLTPAKARTLRQTADGLVRAMVRTDRGSTELTGARVRSGERGPRMYFTISKALVAGLLDAGLVTVTQRGAPWEADVAVTDSGRAWLEAHPEG